MPRKKSPAAPPPVNLLHHPAAAKRSAELTQLVDQLAHPDLAWRYRNDRPQGLTDSSLGGPPTYWPRSTTTVFHPPEDVRGFYLPTTSWELFIEILMIRFREWCELKRDDDDFWFSGSIEGRTHILAAIAWAIELIENRNPVDVSNPPAQELLMHWCRWFGVLLYQLELGAEFCPPDQLRQYISAVFTLRTQCCPCNWHHLTGIDAKAQVSAAVDEQLNEQSYRKRFRI